MGYFCLLFITNLGGIAHFVMGEQDIGFWDAASGQHLGTLNLYGIGVAFSPDGTYRAVGHGWDIHIYRMDDIRRVLREA